MRYTGLSLFLLPLLATSQSLFSQPDESSPQTPPLNPPSILEIRAAPPAVPVPAVPAVPVPAVPAVPVPAVPAPAAPNAPAGGVGGGAPAGASPDVTQVPTVSTVMQNTVIGGVPTQRPVVFTQTFAKVPSQGPTPEKGTIGLGTLAKGVAATETGKPRRLAKREGVWGACTWKQGFLNCGW